MSGTFASIKQELAWKARDLKERWRALPKPTQWKVALSSLAFGLVCLSVTVWAVFFRTPKSAPPEERVTLYTSVDEPIARPIVEAFEQKTGIRVLLVTDTEATKITGLIERLVREKDQPRADVWWSGDMMGTLALARQNLLEPFSSREEATVQGGWPRELRDTDQLWYGYAIRSRVIAYNTNRVADANAPRTLRELTDGKWLGKVGIARPQFGSTRKHIAALVAMHGRDATREWMLAMRGNGVKLYDGNSTVVTALAAGEIEIGLTDTDDVLSARLNDAPVAMVFESVDKDPAKVRGLPSVGAVLLPSTVARIRGGPHPNEAKRLTDYLLSAEVERALALSPSGNIPIRADLRKELKIADPPQAAPVPAGLLAESLAIADALIAEVFPVQ